MDLQHKQVMIPLQHNVLPYASAATFPQLQPAFMLPTMPLWQPHQLAPVQPPVTQQSAEDLDKLHSLYAQMVSL